MKSSPLLLISGWAAQPTILQPLAEALAEGQRDVRIVSVHELPALAHGTEQPHSSYALGLKALLEDYAEPVTVAGWSMGGLVAMETASFFPEAFCRLVLVAATAYFIQEEDYPCGVPLAELLALKAGINKTPHPYLEAFFEYVLKPATPGEGEVQRRTEGALAFGLDALFDGLDYLAKADVRESLGQLSAPTLILHGKEDAVIAPEASHFLEEGIPNSRITLIENVGHDLPVCGAELVADAIKAFEI